MMRIPVSKSVLFICWALIVCAGVCGCATIEQSQKSAPSVGESGASTNSKASDPMRLTVALPEIVASVPVEGASQPYQNLHANVEIVLSPNGRDTTRVAMEALARSLGAKVTSELLKTLTEGKTLSARNLGQVRENLTNQARSALEGAIKQDASAAGVTAEGLVVSLYFTGPSIGRAGPR